MIFGMFLSLFFAVLFFGAVYLWCRAEERAHNLVQDKAKLKTALDEALENARQNQQIAEMWQRVSEQTLRVATGQPLDAPDQNAITGDGAAYSVASGMIYVPESTEPIEDDAPAAPRTPRKAPRRRGGKGRW